MVCLSLGLSGGVPGDHGEIGWDGDFGVGGCVICAEGNERYFGELVAVNVIKGWDPGEFGQLK